MWRNELWKQLYEDRMLTLRGFFSSETGLSHADPVVPILIACIFITLAAALGGLLMKWMKQPSVLGELLVGLLAGNLGYYLRQFQA